ncbi:hypothetical protein AAK894_02395 [Lachnospiraceae bacterium 46-61]
MSIIVNIEGGDSAITLTDRSIIKSEYSISSGEQIPYMEESVDTLTLTGEIDLHSGGMETVNISKLAEFAFCPSESEKCYRQLDMKVYDSIGDNIQHLHFENAFVVEYQDSFYTTKGRAVYKIVIRDCKGTHKA